MNLEWSSSNFSLVEYSIMVQGLGNKGGWDALTHVLCCPQKEYNKKSPLGQAISPFFQHRNMWLKMMNDKLIFLLDMILHKVQTAKCESSLRWPTCGRMLEVATCQTLKAILVSSLALKGYWILFLKTTWFPQTRPPRCNSPRRSKYEWSPSSETPRTSTKWLDQRWNTWPSTLALIYPGLILSNVNYNSRIWSNATLSSWLDIIAISRPWASTSSVNSRLWWLRFSTSITFSYTITFLS